MKTHASLSTLLLVGLLQACGGGGGGGGDAAPAPGAGVEPAPVPTVPVAGDIAGVPGSKCGIEYLPQARVLDLDKAGYSSWYNAKVVCTMADASKQVIEGLPAASFKFTGNGVADAPAEAVLVGTSALDGKQTYQLQTYRHFADAASVTAADEVLTVAGQDALGRNVKATGSVNPTGSFNLAVDSMTGPVIVAASRVLDADGYGYKATTHVVAWAAKTPSTAPVCGAGTTGAPSKDFALVSTNANGQARDARYCLFVDLQPADFFYVRGTNSAVNSWKWSAGAEAGLAPSILTVDSVEVVPATLAGLRLPIYKVTSSVRFASKPSPSFDAVESGPGWLYTDNPALGLVDQLTVNNGGSWNR